MTIKRTAIIVARLAQSVEHETLNLRVVGSSPTLGALFFLHTHVSHYIITCACIIIML